MPLVLHRLLAALHRHGVHAAVLAGLVMMPAVIAAGFWTGSETTPAHSDTAVDTPLRGTFEPAAPRPRS